MSEQDKNPEDPLEAWRGYLKGGFDQAVQLAEERLDAASRELRSALKSGERLAVEAYNYVEETVGKERVIGAILGAKAGGTIGMIGGVPGMLGAGTIGAFGGFIGGPRLLAWYNREDGEGSNDNKPPAPPETPKTVNRPEEP